MGIDQVHAGARRRPPGQPSHRGGAGLHRPAISQDYMTVAKCGRPRDSAPTTTSPRGASADPLQCSPSGRRDPALQRWSAPDSVDKLDALRREPMDGHDCVIHLASNPTSRRAATEPRSSTSGPRHELDHNVVERRRCATTSAQRLLYASRQRGRLRRLGTPRRRADHGPTCCGFLSTYGPPASQGRRKGDLELRVMFGLSTAARSALAPTWSVRETDPRVGLRTFERRTAAPRAARAAPSCDGRPEQVVHQRSPRSSAPRTERPHAGTPDCHVRTRTTSRPRDYITRLTS